MTEATMVALAALRGKSELRVFRAVIMELIMDVSRERSGEEFDISKMPFTNGQINGLTRLHDLMLQAEHEDKEDDDDG